MNSRFAKTAIAAIAVALTVGIAAPAQAATTPVAPSVKTFRSQAVTEMRGYEAQLASKGGLTTAEKARIHALVIKADRRLGSLAAATTRLDRATGAKRAASKAAAVKAFDTAKKESDTAISEIEPLAMKTMNIMELLKAKRGIDDLKARFNALGAKIRAS